MKTIITFLALLSALLLLTPRAWGARDLGTFRYWKVGQVDDHSLWHKPACVAANVADRVASLELYAEKDRESGLYDDPTVQIVTVARFPSYVRGVMTVGKETFHLMLATTGDNPALPGLIARADDRLKILEALRSRKNSSVTVKFVNHLGRTAKEVSFRLRGASDAFAAATSGCRLVLD